MRVGCRKTMAEMPAQSSSGTSDSSRATSSTVHAWRQSRVGGSTKNHVVRSRIVREQRTGSFRTRANERSPYEYGCGMTCRLS